LADLRTLGPGLSATRDQGKLAAIIIEALATNLELDLATFGAVHSKVAEDLNRLGLILHAVGRRVEAKAHFEGALAIHEKIHGPYHSDIASDLNNVAAVAVDMGDNALARTSWERALAIDEASFGPSHPRVKSDLCNLLEILRDLGEATTSSLQDALSAPVDDQEAGHPSADSVLESMGLTIDDLGPTPGGRKARSAWLSWPAIEPAPQAKPSSTLSRTSESLDTQLWSPWSEAPSSEAPWAESPRSDNEPGAAEPSAEPPAAGRSAARAASIFGDDAFAWAPEVPSEPNPLDQAQTAMSLQVIQRPIQLDLTNAPDETLFDPYGSSGGIFASRKVGERAPTSAPAPGGTPPEDPFGEPQRRFRSEPGIAAGAGPSMSSGELPDLLPELEQNPFVSDEIGALFAQLATDAQDGADPEPSFPGQETVLMDLIELNRAEPTADSDAGELEPAFSELAEQTSAPVSNPPRLGDRTSLMPAGSSTQAPPQPDGSEAAADYSADYSKGGAQLFSQGRLARDLGDLETAKQLFEQALVADEAANGPDHPTVAADLSGLGATLRDLRDLRGAREAFERALAINESALGPNHASLGPDLSDLGELLRDMGDLQRARTALERAVTIGRAAHGPDHPTLSVALNSLAGVLSSLGDLHAARAALQKALSIDETAYGKDHPKVATRLNNLGSVLRAQSDLLGARACLERALAITEAASGPDDPKVAVRLGNLGNVLRDLGDPFAARTRFTRALAIDEASLGPDHPRVAARLVGLAGVLQTIGDHSGARSHMERALQITEATYGRAHPKYIARASQLAQMTGR
jgi:tetratricopeptide (TPR) repeat protein